MITVTAALCCTTWNLDDDRRTVMRAGLTRRSRRAVTGVPASPLVPVAAALSAVRPSVAVAVGGPAGGAGAATGPRLREKVLDELRRRRRLLRPATWADAAPTMQPGMEEQLKAQVRVKPRLILEPSSNASSCKSAYTSSSRATVGPVLKYCF